MADPKEQIIEQAVFGGQMVVEETAVIQLQFPYNLNPEIVKTILENGATATVANSILSLNSGSNPNSLSLIFSKAIAPYHSGQGQSVKFSLILSEGQIGSEQLFGVGDTNDGFMLGMKDTDFIVTRIQGGVKETYSFTITSGAVTSSGDITITLDDATTVIPVLVTDSISEVGTKITAGSYPGWIVNVAGDIVTFISIENDPRTGAFSFVDTDTTGVDVTVVKEQTGAIPTEFITKQSDFNKNKLSWVDLQKGNVFRIRYQWLGFGKIIFEIEQPKLERFIPFHVITYANENIIPSIQNPSLPICASVKNTTNTTPVTMSTSSAAIFVEGKIRPLEVLHNVSVEEITVDTDETPIISLHNPLVFAGKTNRIVSKVEILSAVTDGTKGVFFTMSRNSPLIGPANFVDHETGVSPMKFDTSSTGMGTLDSILSTGLGKIDSRVMILDDVIDIFIPPGDTIIISGHTKVSSNDAVSVSATWKDLF